MGIPPTILGVVFAPIFLWLLSLPIFLLSVGVFFAGYAFQFLGHIVDGTQPGEWKKLRKWLHRKDGLFPPQTRQATG
jgi:hypothetical protein